MICHFACVVWRAGGEGQNTDRTKEDDDAHHQEPEGQEGMTGTSVKIEEACRETGDTPADQAHS